MKRLILLAAVVALTGCAAAVPEEIYQHPKLGQAKLQEHYRECSQQADKFGYINMSPAFNFPLESMRDRWQRKKILNFCMSGKGYEI